MSESLLSISRLTKEYRATNGGSVRALRGVDLVIEHGTTLAVVGESGCGKTTLARCILGAITPTSGSIRFHGTELSSLSRSELRRLRSRFGFVQQNPTTSLDPQMRVRDIIAEPLRTHKHMGGRELRLRVGELAELVSLRPTVLQQRPMELSGGQAQRVAIARAIALRPELIILDEPTSALDLSVQAQVLNLLLDLQRQLSLTYILISHDLDVVQHLSDTLAVMYLGSVVERGGAEAIDRLPRHPYTTALLSATPSIEQVSRRERIMLRGDVPEADQVAVGCAFRSRCWRWESMRKPTVCEELAPDLSLVADGVAVACHFPAESVAVSSISASP